MPPSSSPSKANVVSIRFGTSAPAGAGGVFPLDSPDGLVAWETPGSGPAGESAGDDALHLVVDPDGRAGGEGSNVPIVVQGKRGSVRWKPGVAVVSGEWSSDAELRQAVVQFAFLESRLRQLEGELAGCEKDLAADMERGLKIRTEDVAHVDRFAELTKRCYALWAKHVHWAERFARPTPSLPQTARRLMARLMKRADMEARSETFDQRLEVCTELYEGATDRIADFRWYRNGHLLESIIVWLLIVEVIFLAADFGLRIYEYLHPE